MLNSVSDTEVGICIECDKLFLCRDGCVNMCPECTLIKELGINKGEKKLWI